MAGDEDVDVGEKLTAPPDFDGPTSNRRCTDVLCTVLLWAMWISMTGLGIYGAQNGDYRLLVYPLDYAGNVCGTAAGPLDMTEYPYLYYVNDFSAGVCVKECPRLESLADPYTLVTYDGLYQADGATVSADDIDIADYSASNNTLACTADLCYPDGDPESSFTSRGVNEGKGFAYYALDTYEVLWRCVFRDEATEALNAVVNPDGRDALADVVDAAKHSERFEDANEFFDNLFGDLWVARSFILVFGFGAPLVVGFCYAFLLRLPGVLNLVVWCSILATIGIFFAAGWFSGDTAQRWESANPPTYSENQVQAATISSYVFYAAGGLLVLLFLFMRKRIQLAMGCVKETGKALTKMPLIILFPVAQGLGFLIFMAAWIFYGVHLASMGDFSTTTYDAGDLQVTVRLFTYNDFMRRLGWYMLFCFFWSGQHILALGEIIFAMAVAKWYFARDKSSIGNGTVVASITASIWYHTGTAAFGSLIIATIKMIRSFIAYLQRKANELNSSIAKAVLCCCQCCFWCLEKCMKYINKNAYIQTAIFSSSFCTSSKSACLLILRNAARLGAVAYVSGGVVFVGRIFITSLCCGVAFITIEEYAQELHSMLGPLCVIAFTSWFISGMFMSIYDMGVATIIQCFVADEEMFSSSDQMYAGGSLKTWVDNHA